MPSLERGRCTCIVRCSREFIPYPLVPAEYALILYSDGNTPVPTLELGDFRPLSLAQLYIFEASVVLRMHRIVLA